MKAWIAATSNSRKNMKIEKPNETGTKPHPTALLSAPKINIIEITLKITMCPAKILGNKRIISATGLINNEIISIGTKINFIP